MRAIYHIDGRKPDISRLRTRFPSVEFVSTSTDEELVTELGRSEALLINGADFSAAASKAAHASGTLKWIQFASSGIDGVIRNGGFPAHVVATNVAGLRAGNLSEHAFGMLLFLTRQLRAVEAGRQAKQFLKQELFPGMVSLKGKTMLILGLGAIGQDMARKAKGFGMQVIGISRAYQPDCLIDRVFPREDCDEAFSQADVLMVAAPSDSQTRGFVDARRLGLLKKTAIVLNVSRGDIIEEAALVDACREGRIAGAGLDVMEIEPLPPDSPLWTLDNVIVTPHVGGAGSDQFRQLLDRMGDNIERYLKGEKLENVVTG